MHDPNSASIRLCGLTKRFGSQAALDGVDLQLAIGCRLALIGSSGAGKTTLLRAVAGLEPLESGQIFFGTDELTSLPPNRRNLAMLSQDYPVYPHLDVESNLRTAIESLKLPVDECGSRIEDALQWFALEDLRHRRPAQLSGGQLQRVALAKAIVRRPRLLLLDEPFSQLDPHLRSHSRELILDMARRYGTTLMMVTHDPLDALQIADQIAVMQQGVVLQIDAPEKVYHQPRSRSIAELLSPLGLNELRERDGRSVYVRPESVKLVHAVTSDEVPTSQLAWDGHLIATQFVGFARIALVQLRGGLSSKPIRVLLPFGMDVEPGPVRCIVDQAGLLQF